MANTTWPSAVPKGARYERAKMAALLSEAAEQVAKLQGDVLAESERANELASDMAAEQSSIDRKSLSVEGGKVVGPNGRTFEFGQLTRGQKIMKAVNDQAPTTPVASRGTRLGVSS